MGFEQPGLRSGVEDDDYVTKFRRDGYAVLRGFFDRQEIAEIGAAIDQIHAEGVAHGRSFRHGSPSTSNAIPRRYSRSGSALEPVSRWLPSRRCTSPVGR